MFIRCVKLWLGITAVCILGFTVKVNAANERKVVLAETNQFKEELFFKPKLVSSGKWASIYNEFKEKYRVSLWLLPNGKDKTRLYIGLLARSGSGATFVTVEGWMLGLIPKETKPDFEKVQVSFYKDSEVVIGASFPGFKKMVKSVLSHLAPKGIPEAVEIVFKVAGVGQYDMKRGGTLFEGSENHIPVDVKWSEMRVQGSWAKPTRIHMEIPLSMSLREAQKAIENHGIGLMAAVKTSITNLRIFFLVDRLGASELKRVVKFTPKILPNYPNAEVVSENKVKDFYLDRISRTTDSHQTVVNWYLEESKKRGLPLLKKVKDPNRSQMTNITLLYFVSDRDQATAEKPRIVVLVCNDSRPRYGPTHITYNYYGPPKRMDRRHSDNAARKAIEPLSIDSLPVYHNAQKDPQLKSYYKSSDSPSTIAKWYEEKAKELGLYTTRLKKNGRVYVFASKSLKAAQQLRDHHSFQMNVLVVGIWERKGSTGPSTRFQIILRTR